MVTSELALRALTIVWRHYFLLPDQRGLDFILLSPVKFISTKGVIEEDDNKGVPSSCLLRCSIRWHPLAKQTATISRREWMESCKAMYQPLIDDLNPIFQLDGIEGSIQLLDDKLHLHHNDFFAFSDATEGERVDILHLYAICVSQWALLLVSIWEKLSARYAAYRSKLMQHFESNRQASTAASSAAHFELGVLVYQLSMLPQVDQHLHRIARVLLELDKYLQIFQFESSHRLYYALRMLTTSSRDIRCQQEQRQAETESYMEHLTNWKNGLVELYYSFASLMKLEIVSYGDVMAELLDTALHQLTVERQPFSNVQTILQQANRFRIQLMERIIVSRSVLTAWPTNVYLSVTAAVAGTSNCDKIISFCLDYAYLREMLVLSHCQVLLSQELEMTALSRALICVCDELLQQEDFYQQHDVADVLTLVGTYTDDVFAHDFEGSKWWRGLQYSQQAVRYRLQYVQAMWTDDNTSSDDNSHFWLNTDAAEYCHQLASCYSLMSEYLPQDDFLTNKALYCMYHSLRYARLAWINIQQSAKLTFEDEAWRLSASCYLAISKSMLMMSELDMQCFSFPAATTANQDVEKEDLELYSSQLQELVGLQLENVFQSHELLEGPRTKRAGVRWLKLLMQLASLLFRRIQLLFQAVKHATTSFHSQQYKLRCWLEDAQHFQLEVQAWDKSNDNAAQTIRWSRMDSFLLLLDMYIVEEA